MTAAEVIKIRDQLAAQRAPLEPHWNELAEIYTPFERIDSGTTLVQAADCMFDSTPRQSAMTYANGIVSLVIPREEQWFEFIPPKELEKDEEAKRWYRESSETALEFIESSNFYEEVQEGVFESGVFGTLSLYCGELDEYSGELCFLNQTIGTYFLIEDAKGRVCGHLRDLSYTADQAAEEFGKDKLPAKIGNMVGKPQGMTERFAFIHLVTKRRVAADKDAPANEQLPWVDIVVAVEAKKVVRESGVHEFPFACHRHAKHRKCPYGFGPGSDAKGDSYQLSFLNQLADVGTEKEVFPPLVASADLEGEIAQGATEVTYVDPNSTLGLGAVKDLHSGSLGKFNILENRLDHKKQGVRDAFFVDLFKMFSLRAMEKGQMTAAEAHYLAAEKLTQFSPVYGRFTNETVDNVLGRVFAVLLRAGKFGTPPSAVQRLLDGSKSTGRVRYRNKIALAMAAKENGALVEFFNLLLPVMTAFPELGPVIFDSLKPGVAIRDLLRNAGVPEKWIATLEEFNAAQNGRAQAAAQRAQLENAELATKAAGNLAKAPASIAEGAARQVA